MKIHDDMDDQFGMRVSDPHPFHFFMQGDFMKPLAAAILFGGGELSVRNI
jgi:hypothetical protein